MRTSSTAAEEVQVTLLRPLHGHVEGCRCHLDAARSAYAKVEDDPEEGGIANSSHALALKRLAALKKGKS